MKEHALRLTKGQDLKIEIINYCKEHDIDTAVVLSSVGCIYQYRMRMAGGKEVKEGQGEYEIISLNGTISKAKAHLHLGISDHTMKMYGGHLMDGTLINTTCELVLGELEEYQSIREFDDTTGYDEISFERK